MSDPAATSVAEPATAKGEPSVVEPARAQQVAARRVAESKATVPDATVFADVDVQDALERRPEATLVDVVVRAAALALRDLPRANGAYRDAKFELYPRVNVGVGIVTPDGLVIPTVFDADRKSVDEIASARQALEQRVQDGSVTSPELAGATFTVTATSTPGITAAIGVVQPNQAAILSVGGATPRPVARDGAVAVRTVATLALTSDQRILAGTEAERFLARVRELLEQPTSLG